MSMRDTFLAALLVTVAARLGDWAMEAVRHRAEREDEDVPCPCCSGSGKRKRRDLECP